MIEHGWLNATHPIDKDDEMHICDSCGAQFMGPAYRKHGESLCESCYNDYDWLTDARKYVCFADKEQRRVFIRSLFEVVRALNDEELATSLDWFAYYNDEIDDDFEGLSDVTTPEELSTMIEFVRDALKAGTK